MGDSQVSMDERFEELYRRDRERLMRLVIRHLYRGESSAESVVQSVLLSCAVHLRQVEMGQRDEGDLWRLLFKIALRHINKHNKRTSRGRESGRFPVPFSVLEQQPDRGDGRFDPPDSEAGLEALEREEWIEDLLLRLKEVGLDERERGVFRLKLAGHTIEEIATKTGFMEGTVKALLRRIRDTVTKCSEEMEA